jgi:TRAP-type C4-dicarboxylate transport system permease small subunit
MLPMIRVLDQVFTVAAALIVAATALITCIAVFFRSVLHSSLPWPEEITGYALVWTSFLGAYLGVREDRHIAFDLFVEAMSAPRRKIVQTITDLLVAAFFILLIYESTRMLLVVGNSPLQTIEAVPVGVFIASMPICGVGIVLALCLRIVERWRGSI